MSRRALVAEELGAGLGHITRLIPIARHLRDRGWTPILASHQRDVAQRLAPELAVVDGPPFPTFEFERRDKPLGALPKTVVLSDVWGAIGIGDATALQSRVEQWDDMLRSLAIDAVVFDNAPSLAVTVHERLPAVAVGDGYLLPPRSGTGFARYLAGEQPRFRDEELLASIDAVRAARGWSRVASLADVLQWPRQVLCCPPPLDPFVGERHDACHVYASNAASGASPGVEPPAQPPTFFGYLYDDENLTEALMEVLEGLANAEHDGTLVFPGLADDLVEQLLPYGVTISREPLPFDVHVPRASVIVHFGGLGTATAAARAGRPQLVLARHAENLMNGNTLEALGVARCLPLCAGLRSEDVAEALDILVKDASFAARALALSERLASMPLPLAGSSTARHLEAAFGCEAA